MKARKQARKKTRGKAREPGGGAPARPPRATEASRMLRIIGGRHRGRRLRFPAGVDIRPTPDRVRETLFNWLQPRLDGARVLDLFAGSGALGLEALSRGAAHATFVERERRAADAIATLAREWQESAVDVATADALAWLGKPVSCAFDIVFLDPPYDAELAGPVATALARGWLAPDARVYVERRARVPLPDLPDGWTEMRAGRAGEVGYHLFAT
jgi:16S rRNA (guanine966-N2)-methyltransferase